MIKERYTPSKLTADEKKILLGKTSAATEMIKSFPGFNLPRGLETTAINRRRYLPDEEKVRRKTSSPLSLELRIEM